MQNNDSVTKKQTHRSVPLKVVLFMAVILASIIGFGTSPLLHSFAAGITPAQPTGFKATPGDQSASLSWDVASDTTAYEVQTTDLATNVVSVSAPQTASTFTAGSLAVGHWYRFRVIPLNGSTAGPASIYLDVRTKGFGGSSYASYFALGDSYSSGEGTPPYFDTSCGRSTSGFAYQVGVGAPAPTMIACAGADTDDMDKVSYGLVGDQFWQLMTSGKSTTNALITISIGGNDLGFAPELEKCIVSDCTPDQAALSQKITTLQNRLAQIYLELRNYAPAADIIVVGYPLLLADPSQAVCHDATTQSGLSTAEITMIRTLATQLNTAIQTAAQDAGLTYDAAYATFAGHEACTSNQSNEWINEITANDINGSFHPNLLGQAAYTQSVNLARYLLYVNGQVRQEPFIISTQP
jgi:lysophospholipase L1-like esterase